MNATMAIQQAIFDKLASNTELVALLGGPHIHDGVPDRVKPPYVTFGKFECGDWSTGTEAGEEHMLELVLWSSQAGRKEVAILCDAVRKALAVMPGEVSTHHLVNFTWESTITSRDKDSGYFTASMTFRAVLEPVVGA